MDTDLSRTLAEVDRLRRQLKRDLLELRHRLRLPRPILAAAALPAARRRRAEAGPLEDAVATAATRHRELEFLLDRWGTIRAGEGLARQRLAAEILDAVQEHVAFEEPAVYATASGRADPEAVRAGLERHREMLAFLPEIAVLGPSGDAFRDAVDLLVATVRAHLTTEQRDIIGPLR